MIKQAYSFIHLSIHSQHKDLRDLFCGPKITITSSINLHCKRQIKVNCSLYSQQEAYSKLGGTSELAIRITDSFANTALHKAAEAGNLPCLQWLVGRLPNDCLRNITNHDNLTPLAVAVKV